jgi:hypothetical protein
LTYLFDIGQITSARCIASPEDGRDEALVFKNLKLFGYVDLIAGFFYMLLYFIV